MRKTILTALWLILISALSATAIHSQEMVPTNSAGAFVTTQPAPNGEKRTLADDCNEQLLKTLDALDKAEKAILFLQMEIDARKRLDAINAELLKVKDLIIAEQQKLITLLQGDKKESKFMKAIKTVIKFGERILLLYVGAQIGKGL